MNEKREKKKVYRMTVKANRKKYIRRRNRDNEESHEGNMVLECRKSILCKELQK